jgi:DNA processing protein
MTSARSTGRTLKLHVLGRLPEGGVAIIGSRKPPPEAAEFAYRLAFELGEPVVAGLAHGIDAAAHRGALDAGTPTVAFVPYGFGATDPPDHVELEKAIVEAGGAIATLLPPGTPASQESRVARDRLQAEQARAVVLICSEICGGALYTMRFARELERARFALSPPTSASGAPAWAGNLKCIAEGATPLPFDVEAALAIIAR